jgi:hypothetical protein
VTGINNPGETGKRRKGKREGRLDFSPFSFPVSLFPLLPDGFPALSRLLKNSILPVIARSVSDVAISKYLILF